MKTNISRLIAVVATGLLISAGGIALAQPGPAHGHGPGPGPGADIEHLFMRLETKLNLNSSQQLMWQNAVAQSQAAHATGKANMQQLHDAFAAELAKTTPDLAALATVADNVQASNQALRKSVRGQWLALYATFSADQVAVVRAALQKQLARMDAMRAKMAARMQNNGN
jgi:hypothetical protein